MNERLVHFQGSRAINRDGPLFQFIFNANKGLTFTKQQTEILSTITIFRFIFNSVLSQHFHSDAMLS